MCRYRMSGEKPGRREAGGRIDSGRLFGKKISLPGTYEEAFETLLDYRVIFFGEEHGSSADHTGELAVLSGLSERVPDLVPALEMFERDVQDTLVGYLAGAISEESFLERHILICCGRFHSDYRLGIPCQLRNNHPEIRTAVILSTAAVLGLPVKDRPRITDFFWVGGREAS